ncbi:Hypothetical predicted protein [Olea europaea subsp. europaea]|uniref:Uncharacterized protein n=1 Tax=Olea europaea subsp. europaea TaxID=158383 RepID=A0A8S0SIT4_OLEEU|nr:Hypothetical predicted protein [Olea europaea subsp. europaea]
MIVQVLDLTNYKYRGKRASSTNNPAAEPTFQFIPNPMMSNEACSGGVNCGPVASICSQSIALNVPTESRGTEELKLRLQQEIHCIVEESLGMGMVLLGFMLRNLLQ